MKNRNMKLWMLAGGLAAIITMSNTTSLTAKACENEESNSNNEYIQEDYQSDNCSEFSYVLEADPSPVIEEEPEIVETPEVEEDAETVEIPEVVEDAETVETLEVEEEPETVETSEAVDNQEIVETPVTEEDAETIEILEIVEAPETIEESEQVVEEVVVPDESHLTCKYRKGTIDSSIQAPVFMTYEVYDTGVIRLTYSDIDGNIYREELITGERYDVLAPAIEEKVDEIKKLEAVDDLAYKVQDMSFEELMEFYLNMSTAKADNFNGTYTIEKETGKTSKTTEQIINEKTEKVIKEAGRKTIEKLIKQLPQNDFYINTLKGVLGGVFGLDDDSLKLEDLMEQNSKDKKEIQATIEREIAIAKKENIDVSAIESYGNTLDTFTDMANRRAKAIIEIRDDEDLTDAQKAVLIAELIGDSSDWRKGTDAGSIIVAMESAAKCFKDGKSSDLNSRDLYNIIYEFETRNSLFSGEAMNKAEGYIQIRVDNFIRNCNVVVECLKAHEKVAGLTQEEVDSLDAKTAAIYNRIKTENKDIAKQIKSTITLFFGDENSKFESDHTGIFTAAEEYYNKDRTVYIDNGTRYVRLNDQLTVTHGSDYMNSAGKACDRSKIDSMVSKSGLSKQDVEKIVAMAKARNMTVKEYLTSVGFNTTNIGNGIIAVGSYESKFEGDFFGMVGQGYDYYGVEGYTTYPLNIGWLTVPSDHLVDSPLSKHECDIALWIDFATNVEKINQNMEIYTFQAK